MIDRQCTARRVGTSENLRTRASLGQGQGASRTRVSPSAWIWDDRVAVLHDAAEGAGGGAAVAHREGVGACRRRPSTAVPGQCNRIRHVATCGGSECADGLAEATDVKVARNNQRVHNRGSHHGHTAGLRQRIGNAEFQGAGVDRRATAVGVVAAEDLRTPTSLDQGQRLAGATVLDHAAEVVDARARHTRSRRKEGVGRNVRVIVGAQGEC